MESETVSEIGEVKGGNFEIIQPPNTLASRVSGGGQISDEMLRAAEEIVEAHAIMFTSQSKVDADHLYGIVDEMEKGVDSHAASLEEIFKISHNIKGQGGTFGYDLVTDIAASLCNYSSSLETCDSNGLSLIRAHIDAIRAVISGKMVGDGGKIGQAISQSLGLAVTKLSDC